MHMKIHHQSSRGHAQEGPADARTGSPFNRRSFLQSMGLGLTALWLLPTGCTKGKQPDQEASGQAPIQGFERARETAATKKWAPVSDRKVRVGIIGYGLCKFGAEFGFQHHPNVEVVAVSDLFPDR